MTTTDSTTCVGYCRRATRSRQTCTEPGWRCEATRQVIANGLGILGVSAPERM